MALKMHHYATRKFVWPDVLHAHYSHQSEVRLFGCLSTWLLLLNCVKKNHFEFVFVCILQVYFRITYVSNIQYVQFESMPFQVL